MANLLLIAALCAGTGGSLPGMRGGVAVYTNPETMGPTIFWWEGTQKKKIDVPALAFIQYVRKWGMLAAVDERDGRVIKVGPDRQPTVVLSSLSLGADREEFASITVSPSGDSLIGRTNRLRILKRPLQESKWSQVTPRKDALRLHGVLGTPAQEYDANCVVSPNQRLVAVSFPTQRYLYESAGDRDANTFILDMQSGKWSREVRGVPVGWFSERHLAVRDLATNSIALVDWSGRVVKRRKHDLAMAVAPSVTASVESVGSKDDFCKVSLWSGFFGKRLGQIELPVSKHSLSDSDLAVWTLNPQK